MLVFREGRRVVSGRTLQQALLDSIRQLTGQSSPANRGLLLEALLRAGELECGLADANSPACTSASLVTDALAQALVSSGKSIPNPELLEVLARMDVPGTMAVSTPEGFAYYGLHPLQYAELVRSLPLASATAAVVGIRTIGTTLSAVVAAALRRRGIAADRITLRPAGHPFDRRTEFTFEAQKWIAGRRARRAEFLVVDEGPGLSGSSFLSVGDALLQAGVPRTSIAFLCSRQPEPGRLRARDGAVRWQQFRSYAIAAARRFMVDSAVDVGGGVWREHLCGAACDWPASWVTMERAKYLSRDGRQMFKFEGLGHLAAKAGQRARVLAEAGFAPPCESVGDGFLGYDRQRGQPASRMDLCPALLERVAEYCAFRASAFGDRLSDGEDLARMAAWNLHEEFGIPYEPREEEVETRVAVLTDGRMQPHEWLLTAGNILKTDGVSHGDDHFYPGVTDIAWDLAGAIVEWELGADASNCLLRRYAALSGDEASERVPGFLRAYTAFRMGYCKMAAESLQGTQEEERLLRDYRRYRARAASTLERQMAA